MKAIICLLFCSLMSGGAAAELHKCTYQGKVTFSDQPCPAGMISESIDLPEDNPRVINRPT
jgi:hypothetical protein